MATLETVRAGQLRDRVTFYIRPDETTQDSTGHVDQFNKATDLSTWGIRATNVPGNLDAIRGQEPSEGNMSRLPNIDISEEFLLLSIRYDIGIIPDHTDVVVCNDRRFDIQSIKHIGNRKRKINIVLREVL